MRKVLFSEFKSQKKKACDCVVRSIMKVENLSWEEAYDALCVIGRKMKRMPNEREVITKMLELRGYERVGFKTEKGVKKPTVYDFAEQHPTGIYVASVTGHVVAIVNGRYYDSWDCGDSTIFSYWHKTEA